MQTVKVQLTADQAAELNMAPKRIWDNYAVIGDVQKSTKIKLVVGAGIRDGVRYINIREFYLRKRDGIWKPSKDGITLPIRMPIERGTKVIEPFDDFIKLLYETKEALEIMELSDKEHAVYSGDFNDAEN